MDNEVNSEKNQEKGRVYEVGFHVLPTIGEEKVSGVFGATREFIENGGGIVLSSEMPKFKILSYVMSKDLSGRKSKFKEAYFSWIKFEGGGELARGLEKFMEGNDDILRHIVMRTIRENTMTVPRIPVWKKRELAKDPAVKAEGPAKEEPKVSEDELNKAIDLAIAE